VRMVTSPSLGHASIASAIPVSSGRMEEGWPRTTTLRAGRRPSLATNEAPMEPLLLREPSVATTIPLCWYAAPAGPSRAFREEGHARSRGTTPSAVRQIESAFCFSLRTISSRFLSRALMWPVSAGSPACPPMQTCASIIAAWIGSPCQLLSS
jgi:hypothetical protein